MASAPSSSLPLSKPKDLSHHLSRGTASRAPSNIKQFYKYFSIPGIGQLAGGLPNPDYFPYDTLEAKTALPDRWKPTTNKPVDPSSEQLESSTVTKALPSAHVVVPKTSGTANPIAKVDLRTALQYGTAQGYPPLYGFLRQFTRENLHPNIPYAEGPDIVLTVGNTDGFAKALQTFNNEWTEGRDPIEEREGLLCEHYAYMNAIGAARPRGMNIVPVAIDDEGMLASGKGGLEDAMKNWDYARGKRPHLMYTVTLGQNPTSGVLSVPRRKEIYKLCQKYDVLIIEDEPYWYLQYPSGSATNIANGKQKPAPATSRAQTKQKSSGFDFLDSLVPSYLSVDVDGRVIRLDTFSKTIAPGCRLGWVTAQPAIIERMLRITETSTQQPSGFVQSMVIELLRGPLGASDPGRGGRADGSGWEVAGWVRWLEGLRGNYERRMNAMCHILHDGRHLVKAGRRRSLDLEASGEVDEWAVVDKTRIYDFVWPVGGMFVWVEVDYKSHPLLGHFGGPKLSQALWVFWTTKPYLVLATPGSIFAPTDEIRTESAWKFFRLCFAAIDESALEPVSRRFVEGIHAFWEIKNSKTVQALLDSIEGPSEQQDVISMMGYC